MKRKKKATKPAKIGRPRKVFTEEQWAQMGEWARDMCKAEEIAGWLGVDKPTLYAPHNRERFKALMALKGAERRLQLRRAQFERALDPKSHPAYLIFTMKNFDGQTDKTAITGGDGGPLEMYVTTLATFEEACDAEKKVK